MSNLANIDLEHYAQMFKALANPHRLAVFLRLMTCCPPGTVCDSDEEARRFVGEVGQDLAIAPSTLSHHVKELRQAGLLRVERRGKNIQCWLDARAVSGLADLLSGRSLGIVPETEPQAVVTRH
ncbi:MAG: metalloregulator ArsR/SmtB family transcription factor [Thermodesulfobacteriota bacterium]